MDKEKLYNIEIATVKDIDELEKFYDDINDYLESGINYTGWMKGIYPNRETAETGVKQGILFNLKVGDKIAGSIALHREQEKAYSQGKWSIEADDSQLIVVHTLAVHPDFVRQGIAYKLLDFAKDYAYEKDAKSIRLDVAIQNEPAICLYEKCGYTYAGTVDLELGYEHLKWFKLYELVL